MADEAWPSLPYEEWRDTCATLHLLTQIVGKIRLSLMPWINHSWHVWPGGGPLPEGAVLEFLRSTNAAAADLGGWDRAALERGEDPRVLHGRRA